MKTICIAPLAAALLACATRSLAQAESTEPIERIGVDGLKLGAPLVATVPLVSGEKRPKGPTEITAREATFDNARHLATFTTEVLVRDPEFGLSCERLTVNLKKPAPVGAEKPEPKKAPGEQGSGIEKAIAEGHVVITQDKPNAAGKMERYTGKGDRAVFDNASGTLKLYGWPQISQSVNGVVLKQINAREKGCVITLDRAGKIDVNGFHTSTLQDAADLSQAPR